MKLIGSWFKCYKEKETLIIIERQCHRRICLKIQLFEKGRIEIEKLKLKNQLTLGAFDKVKHKSGFSATDARYLSLGSSDCSASRAVCNVGAGVFCLF